MYAFIGDLHIGVKLPKIDFIKSMTDFLGIIRNHKEECHAIFVCGDFFDRRLSTEELKFASEMMLCLVCNECGRNGRTHVPVYFIHGTYTHDQGQYDIFLPMLQKLDNVEIFYIENACELTLVDGRRALFLPQEYGDISYDKFFKDKHYDIIVGHGPIASNTKNPCKSAKYEIVHSAELLGDISEICVFGHYHGYTDFGNNVFYTGPWLQWKYGEDTPKVFFFCDDEFKVFTEPNRNAMEFKTVEIQNPEQLREYMSQEIETPHRFVINSLPENMDVYRGIINANKSSLVKFQLEEIVDEDDLQLTVDEVLDAQVEASQPIPALVTYIKDKYGVDAEEQLHDYETQINKEEK